MPRLSVRHIISSANLYCHRFLFLSCPWPTHPSIEYIRRLVSLRSKGHSFNCSLVEGQSVIQGAAHSMKLEQRLYDIMAD